MVQASVAFSDIDLGAPGSQQHQPPQGLAESSDLNMERSLSIDVLV